jgi:hypothetical protein
MGIPTEKEIGKFVRDSYKILETLEDEPENKEIYKGSGFRQEGNLNYIQNNKFVFAGNSTTLFVLEGYSIDLFNKKLGSLTAMLDENIDAKRYRQIAENVRAELADFWGDANMERRYASTFRFEGAERGWALLKKEAVDRSTKRVTLSFSCESVPAERTEALFNAIYSPFRGTE